MPYRRFKYYLTKDQKDTILEKLEEYDQKNNLDRVTRDTSLELSVQEMRIKF